MSKWSPEQAARIGARLGPLITAKPRFDLIFRAVQDLGRAEGMSAQAIYQGLVKILPASLGKVPGYEELLDLYGEPGSPKWFFVSEGRKHGPIEEHSLVHRLLTELPSNTLVWRQELSGWTPAREVAELAARVPPPLPTQEAHAGSAAHPVETRGSGEWGADDWAEMSLHLMSPMGAFSPRPSRIREALRGLGSDIDRRAAYDAFLSLRPEGWPVLPDYEHLVQD